jgi:hypothetical protein
MSYRKGDLITEITDCWGDKVLISVSECENESRVLLDTIRSRTSLNHEKWETIKKSVDLFFKEKRE